MSKKVLIMSASTGGGHNRAAKAMKEEIEKRCINGEYITCEIVDSLKLINTTMDKIISSGYEKSAKYTPKAWGGVYKISDANIMSKHEFKGNLFNSLLSSRLKKLLKDDTKVFEKSTFKFVEGYKIYLTESKESGIKQMNNVIKYFEFIESKNIALYFQKRLNELVD